MELEQFYVFEIQSPLTPDKRRIVEQHIDDNAVAFGQNITRSWHQREGEHFLRIAVDPVVVEIVFLNEKIELYGAAPSWARLLFTAARKEELKEKIADVIVVAGFTTAETLAAQKPPQKRGLFARARSKNAVGDD